MPTPLLSESVMREAVEAVQRYGGIKPAARALGIPSSTFKGRYRAALERLPDASFPPQDDWQRDEPAATFPGIPSKLPTYDELKQLRIADFNRLDRHKQAVKLLRVQVRIDGAYGILVMGDPHVDDDGCDWPTLDRHIALIRKTEGLFGANVGDLTNNWIGRLARLYGDQNMGRERALVLVEGFLREVRWLWIDPGNHDLWSGHDDPVRWLTRFAGVHYKWQGSRLELVPPNGASVLVNSRHDHPGYSMYHPTHGPLKAAIMDGHGDDIYTCGHIHSGGYHLHIHPTGKASHLFRASSYKVYDNHKDERGFRDQHLPAGVFIVRPESANPHGRVTFFADAEEGADYLRFLRRPRVRVQAAAA